MEAKESRHSEDSAAEPDMTSQQLRQASVRGGAVTGIAQLAKLVLRTGSTAVLARALAPEEYGLIAMATVVTGFAGIFMDGGLGLASVQRTNLRKDQMNALFWINVAIGLVLTVILAAVSPLVASFFNEPRLVWVTCALSLNFIINSLAIQPTASLHRNMKFLAMARVELLSMAVGIIVAIVMAYSGLGYWALVGMPLGQAVANVILSFREARWRPGMPATASGLRETLKFGFDVLGFNILIYACRKGDNLLIGWYWGALSLGLYDKAYGLLLLPLSQINGPICRVTLPVMARAKNSPDELRTYVADMMFCIASIGTIVVAGLFLFSEQVVAILLGKAWMEAVPVFQALSLAALMGLLQNPTGWVLMAVGETKSLKVMGGVNSFLFLLSFAIGLPHGLVAMAHCYSVASLLAAAWSWWYVAKVTGIGLSSLRKALLPPLVAMAAGLLGAYGLQQATSGMSLTLVRDLIIGGGLVSVYAIVLLGGFSKWSYFLRGLNMMGLKFQRA
jgi:PST family polysaccharide transporter